MLFYVILSLLFSISMLVLLNRFGALFSLEATDSSTATLLLDGGNVRFFDVVTALFRGGIILRFHQGIDTDISIPCQAYGLANASHPPHPLTQDWEGVADAALSSTREAIKHFKQGSGSGDDTQLHLFIQTIILSTFLRLFFRLTTTPTNVEDVVWIVSKTWEAEDCWQAFVRNPSELYRLVKPSPNPFGIFALLSAAQQLTLAAACILECRGESFRFIRQAGTLLQHPNLPQPDVIQLVEKVNQSNPPIQSVHGRLSLGYLPLHRICGLDFFIPVSALPPSACILGPDGACISWLHKAALPSRSACGGGAWLIRATAIILSAIETEIRNAGLTIDGGDRDQEAWEEWVIRRLRVG
jgi:hypothetical protein